MGIASKMTCDYCSKEEVVNDKLKSGWLQVFSGSQLLVFCSRECGGKYLLEDNSAKG